MEFSFTTLGIASALPTADSYPSAHVFKCRGRLFLIDCGEGCQALMRRSGISILKIENIFLSHLHGDHIFGIFGLLSTMILQGRTAPLYIYAPKAFHHTLKYFKDYHGDGMLYEIVFVPLEMKEKMKIIDLHNLEVYAFPMNHKIETFGFLFKEKEPQLNVHKYLVEADNLSLHEIAMLKNGEDVIREDGEILENQKYTYIPFEPRSFAYCSDTAPFERQAEWISGVNLLYHEATYCSDNTDRASKSFNSTAAQAAQVASTADAGKLILGHFSSRYADKKQFLQEARDIFAESYLASEGTVFEVPLKRLDY